MAALEKSRCRAGSVGCLRASASPREFPTLSFDLHPGRRVVAGLVAAAIALVDAGVAEAVGGLGAEQEMVDAEARVALPAARGIIPEGVDRAFRIAGADRVGEAE